MLSRETVIRSENGIGAKQAAKLVNNSMEYASEIFLEQGNKKVNAKSIMGVISLALKPGDSLTVVAVGDDEENALKGTIAMLHSL